MIQSIFDFLGRALISIIFIFSAGHKILDWNNTEQFLHQTLTDWMPVTFGSPSMQGGLDWALANTTTLLCLAVLFELIGGLLVFLGLWVRLGAFLLVCFLFASTLVFHHFWDFAEPQRQIEMVSFMKNVSIMGGLLFILARGKSDSSPSSTQKDS